MANFIDKIVSSLNKGVSTVSESSKLMVERTKVSSQRDSLLKEINILYINLGELMYNLQKNGLAKVEQTSGIMNELDMLHKKLSELERQIQELSNQKVLASQGYAAGKSNVTNNEKAEGILCSCGYLNDADAIFCGECGSKLSVQEKEATAENSTEAETTVEETQACDNTDLEDDVEEKEE